VSLAIRIQGGADPRPEGARSKAGRVKAWPVTLGRWINRRGKAGREEARP